MKPKTFNNIAFICVQYVELLTDDLSNDACNKILDRIAKNNVL